MIGPKAKEKKEINDKPFKKRFDWQCNEYKKGKLKNYKRCGDKSLQQHKSYVINKEKSIKKFEKKWTGKNYK
jgi:hypothetical protein